MSLPAPGDLVEFKLPKASGWKADTVTRVVDSTEGRGFCVGKSKKELWFSEKSEGQLWRRPD